MKDNLIHLCFIIDESGSMWGSESDVTGGFNKLIEEQRKVEEGNCLVSVYRFNSIVTEDFVGRDIKEIDGLPYSPGGNTALYDGIGTAVDSIGKWLNDMPEEDRPSKNMIVIMTDGGENYSKEYDLTKVRDMIKHQEDKYNWSFVYMGSDLTNLNDANNLGLKMRSVSGKANIMNNYYHINDYTRKLRSAKSEMDVINAHTVLGCALSEDTAVYAANTGISLDEEL